MLSFVKTAAENGEIRYTALDGETGIGGCVLRLTGREIELSCTADAYEEFVLASAVNAAAAFGLPVRTAPDKRLKKYGFTECDGCMRARPDEIKFPSACGGNA